MRKELTLSLLRQRDVLQRISVTPREIDQYLEKQKNAPSAANEYNVSHILIAVPQAATANELDAASKRADEVYQRRRAARTSRSLRSPTRTARTPSTAAPSTGARVPSCRPSSRTSS